MVNSGSGGIFILRVNAAIDWSKLFLIIAAEYVKFDIRSNEDLGIFNNLSKFAIEMKS